MSSKWEEVPLGEVISNQIDNRGRNPKKYVDYSNYPVIDNYLIKNQKYPDISKVNRYIDEDTFKNFLRGYIKKDDVLITLVGNGIGNVTMAPCSNSVIIQNTIGLRSNEKTINLFLYYLLLYNQEEIKNFNRGTSQPSIKKTDLFKFILKLPPLEEQKAIAHILSTLDEKIEINNQINKKLEEMAQTIFKHWFVDFEFPNENREPYKSSGGEMVESDFGMIPKGWKVGCIGDYAKVKSGFAFKSTWWKEEGIPVIKIKNLQKNTIDFNDVGYVESDKIEKAKEFIVKGGDLLIAMTGATIGKLGLVPKYDGTILVNQRVGKFFLGENPLERIGFLYCLITQKSIYEEIVSRGDGSAQPNISPSQIESIKIILPPKEKIDEINKVLKGKFELMVQKIKENEQLTQLRDTLLPKLMSGEIRVPLESEDDIS